MSTHSFEFLCFHGSSGSGTGNDAIVLNLAHRVLIGSLVSPFNEPQ